MVTVGGDFRFRRARRDGGLRACRGEASQRAAYRDKASRACRGEVLKCSFWICFSSDFWYFELRACGEVPRGYFGTL